MNGPDIYQKTNQIQRHDAHESLKEFSNLIAWKPHTASSIVDIGCGDGSVTTEILKKFLPSGHQRLVGCDNNESFIRFANEKYSDERTSFEVLDIQEKLPKRHKEKYDHLFSFYTLHWVQEQKKAMKNIFKMLKRGGDCLLVFLANMPIYDVYKILSHNPKWAQYMYDVDKYISPYQYSDYPDSEFRKLMKKVGFSRIKVECKEKMFVYRDIEVLKKALSTIVPFNHRLSPVQREHFVQDYMEAVRNLNLIDDMNNNDSSSCSIRCPYTLMIAYGYKK